MYRMNMLQGCMVQYTSRVAQRKRAGPITQRSMDRNHPLLRWGCFPPEEIFRSREESLLGNLPLYIFFREVFRSLFWGSPGGSDGKESACNAGDQGLIPGLGRSPRREWLPTPIFLPGESHGQRSLAGYSPWGRKESAMAEVT